MRILANENFPGDAVKVLRARGHDVVWLRTDSPGCSDEMALRRAAGENRLVVTFDKDFGQLAFLWGLPAEAGVVLFRLAPLSPDFVVELAVRVLESRSDWAGHFSVVEEARIRMTPLPERRAPPH